MRHLTTASAQVLRLSERFLITFCGSVGMDILSDLLCAFHRMNFILIQNIIKYINRTLSYMLHMCVSEVTLCVFEFVALNLWKFLSSEVFCSADKFGVH